MDFQFLIFWLFNNPGTSHVHHIGGPFEWTRLFRKRWITNYLSKNKKNSVTKFHIAMPSRDFKNYHLFIIDSEGCANL